MAGSLHLRRRPSGLWPLLLAAAPLAVIQAGCLLASVLPFAGARRGLGPSSPAPRHRLYIVRKAAAPSVMEIKELTGTHDGMRILYKIERLDIRRGQKIAVVGANGCGKSTLLTSLVGKEQTDEVSRMPNCQITVVEQSPKYDPEKSVSEVILENSASAQSLALRRYNRAMTRDDPDELQAAIDEMSQLEAWDFEDKIKGIMKECGLEKLQDSPIGQLSGGEERRVALACALIDLGSTDLLVLDEPTNHLSAEGCEWLQTTLQGLRDVALLLVTHDRYFLDEVCDNILELDGLGEAHLHSGGWKGFLKGRAKRLEAKAAEVHSAKVQLKRAKAWMARGVRGRGTKNKAQINAFWKTKADAEEIIKADDGKPTFTTAVKQGVSGITYGTIGQVKLEGVTVPRDSGKAILDNVTLEIPSGTKMGIVGPNGAGKSTLLRVIARDIEPSSGKLAIGEGVVMGYLSQQPPNWRSESQTVWDAVAEMADHAMFSEAPLVPNMGDMNRMAAAARLLGLVNFNRERWQTRVGMLSGGEVRRLQLLKVLSDGPNVLILDEPTNDMDAVTVDSLEQLLKDWKGTVILVSHDRSLLDGVCSQLLVFPEDGGNPRIWGGSHEELRLYQKEEWARLRAAAEEAEAKAKEDSAKAAPKAPTVSAQEQKKRERQLKKVEKAIERTEAELELLQERMAAVGENQEELMELFPQNERLEKKQEDLYARYEELLLLAEE